MICGYFRVEKKTPTHSVTCLTADICLIADPGVASLIPAQSHTFEEIDYAIISTVILLLSADSRRVVVSYKPKYVHRVLVNRLVRLAQDKTVFKCTDRPDMTLAVDWDVKHQTNPKPQNRVNADETAPLETGLSWFTLLYIFGPSDKCVVLNINLLIYYSTKTYIVGQFFCAHKINV